MRMFFEQRLELAPNIWQFGFRPEQAIDFEPGQYADLRLTSAHLAPPDRSRTFSLASLPTDASLNFVTKIESPMSPYKTALQAMRAGDTADLTEPMGDFILPKSPAIPLVLVAGGIGIASYVSMTRWLAQQHQKRPITIFYAVRQKSDIIFPEIFKNTFTAQIIQAPARLTAAQIHQAITPQSLIYLSGSQNFVENLRNDLLKLGVENYRLIFEYYTGYFEL